MGRGRKQVELVSPRGFERGEWCLGLGGVLLTQFFVFGGRLFGKLCAGGRIFELGGHDDHLRSVLDPGHDAGIFGGNLEGGVELRGGGTAHEHGDAQAGIADGAHGDDHLVERGGDES